MPRLSPRLVLAVLAGLTIPSLAVAQAIPVVNVSPHGKYVSSGGSVTVGIDWCIPGGGSLNSQWVHFNGSDVTSNFSSVYHTAPSWCNGPNDYYEYWTGSVTVPDGDNEIVAQAETGYGYAGSDYGLYDTFAPNRQVQVSAASQSINSLPDSPSSTVFTVTNTGAGSETFNFSISCDVHISCGSLSATSATIAAGSSTNVTAGYTAGSAGTTGVMAFTATNSAASTSTDRTWTEVTAASNASAGVVIVGGQDVRERSLCLAAAIGPETAYECGDLRIAHALPAIKTLNKDRTPVLVYNSAWAAPNVLVSADVTLPSSTAASSVEATLTTNFYGNLTSYNYSWDGSAWGTAGETRRITMAASASGAGTNLHSISLEVRYIVNGTSYVLADVSGYTTVVDRTSSWAGAGWWLDGMEQLVARGGNSFFWTGGDGSTRLFTNYATNFWLAETVDRADTLTYDGTYYIHHLPNNNRVYFDASGLMTYVVNRFSDTTKYHWTWGGYGVSMTSIDVPTASGYLTYTFNYNGLQQLTSISSPGPSGSRTTTIGMNTSNNRVESIQDPDGHTVYMGFDASLPFLVNSRTDRRGKTTTFSYDVGRKLTQSSLDMGGAAYLTNGFGSVETVGLSGAPRSAAAPEDSAYSYVDGPRSNVADVTKFWFTTYGGISRVRNPLGHETKLTYGNTTYPALVTQVRDASEFITDVAYNSRGLDSVVTRENPLGNSSNYATTYSWDGKWNFPTQIHTAAGVTTTMSYNGTTGVRDWLQVGDDTNRVNFTYDGHGRVTTVTAPSTVAESLFYDTSLGNLSADKQPNGGTYQFSRDAIGREVQGLAPMSASVNITTLNSFDAMNRLTQVKTIGAQINAPNIQAPLDTLVVSNTYNEEGWPTEVQRTRGTAYFAGYGTINSNYTYDNAGRKTVETNGGTEIDYAYDQAGNVTSRTSGHGTTYMTYDAANQLTRRIVPEVDYSSTSCTAFITTDYCFFSLPIISSPNSSYPVCIPADTAYFQYDPMGRITRADNIYARVHRGYTPGGLLQADSAWTRSWISSGFAPCEIDPNSDNIAPEFDGVSPAVSSFTYDGDGRRASIHFSGGTQYYSYSAGSAAPTGALTGVTDVNGNSYGLVHDAAGRLYQVQYPGSVTDTRNYGSDGQLSSRQIPGILDDSYGYDLGGRITSAYNTYRSGSGYYGNANTYYSGLGAVIEADGYGASAWAETFKVDALGNRLRRQQAGDRPYWHPDALGVRFNTFDASGLLTAVADTDLGPNDPYVYTSTYSYDLAGAQNIFATRETDYTCGCGTLFDSNISYFGADDKLRVHNRFEGLGGGSDDSRAGYRGTFDEYRYDALGRRILVRSRKGSGCITSTIECVSYLERTVWDGDQVLTEQRSGGSSSMSDDQLDYFTGGCSPSDSCGSIAYTHGLGLDEPLSVIKTNLGQTIMPHTNWRGEFEIGTTASGGVVKPGCGCPELAWPGGQTLTDGKYPIAPTVTTWWGNLITANADASGLQYRRNRYYDPETGRFTQEDPITLRGGSNLYGFADGDPVNNGDPFGLSPDCTDGGGKTVPCPEPPGGPPIPLAEGKNGKPNEWVPVPGTSGGRTTKYKPKYPVRSPTGAQPGASWDPEGHWDGDDGNGSRRRYAPDGTEVDHDGNPVRTPLERVRDFLNGPTPGWLPNLPKMPILLPLPLPMPVPIP